MVIHKKKHDDLAINGGEKCFDTVKTTMNLPAPEFDDYYKRIGLYEDGSKDPIHDLESALSVFHGVDYTVCFSSCFTAMAMTLKALALPGRQNVIIPSLTYRRMSDIILWAGLTPCFCDNDPSTLGVSAAGIERQIGNNTALILAPHPIVNFSDISSIETLGFEREIPVVFDSVEAIAGYHQGVPVGAFGMAESFSLHPSKLMNACEGGYITTNSQELYLALIIMRDGGAAECNGALRHGHISRMNRYHAVMGLCSLDMVNETIRNNYKYYCIYRSGLKGIKGIKLVEYDEDNRRNYKSILVEVTDDYCITRDQLHDILNYENVYARKFYYPAQHLTQSNQSEECAESYEVAEYLQDRYLLLPFGHSTSADDIRDICELINTVQSITSNS
ncbi:MAG: aminotransferase class I/II-fold pyridoxal phosphate-dependent enzyme [Gammaproteobacteria bacterium]|nr:aminotransferase class I/II-fold pyridoxal phosphate-dependent enzyme [Gammaproteobacteria bacterium]